MPQVMFFEPIYIPRTLTTGTCIQQGDLFYSAGLSRNHVLATANTGEIRKGFEKKMQANGREGQKQARKISLAASAAHMTTHRPTPGFKGRLFELCVLTRWDFDFCIRSFPLRDFVGTLENATCPVRNG